MNIKWTTFFYVISRLCLLFLCNICLMVGAEEADGLPKETETIATDSDKKISLDLKGIDITELFRILSLKMGITIVPTRSVSGRINIFLNNLTFEDALDVILVSQDLAAERQGNIVNVMTNSEYEKLNGRRYNEKRKFKNIKLNYAKPSTVFNALTQIRSDIGKVIVDETSATLFLMDTPERLEIMTNTVKELDVPPSMEVFDLQYAKAEDIKSHLSSVITPGPGELFVDSHSTKVVVSDLPGKMKKIKQIISAFDSQTPQVLIETKIIEITLKDEKQHEINWERILTSLHKHISQLDVVGKFPVAPSFTPSPALSTDNMEVSLGTLDSDKFTSTFRILETLGRTKIASSPNIVTVNNQEAKIMVGSREAYVIQSLAQSAGTNIAAENVQFIDVGIKLNVMPTIHKDGFISLRIKPEVSSVREIITTKMGSRVPIVDTSEAETTVKIKEGTMVMIAGLYKDNAQNDNGGAPVVSRVPFLRTGFASRAALKKRTEFVVFLTPRIITGDLALTKKTIDDTASQGLYSGLPDVQSAEVVSPPVASEVNVREKLKGLKKY